MLDFIERLADATGLPVGIKSAVGEMDFWPSSRAQIDTTGARPDFITDRRRRGRHRRRAAGVQPTTSRCPSSSASPRCTGVFAERGDLHENVVFIGSGKLGFPAQSLLALGLGCDLINVAREAMLSIGCIQAQQCHTGHCPTGIATQSAGWSAASTPPPKSARLANYLIALRKELLRSRTRAARSTRRSSARPHVDIVDGPQPPLGPRRVRLRPGLGPADAHFGPKDRPVLCGNSIHQDRRFIRRYLPAFDARLHYRMIDVSTIKELGRRWYPTELAAQPAKAESHRALDDIRESIAELRYYRAHLFKQITPA
jgi:hypothetical protein